jgi:hypothetical protein
MKSVSIIVAAAAMLASSVNAASNDPRECEGELLYFHSVGIFIFWAALLCC